MIQGGMLRESGILFGGSCPAVAKGIQEIKVSVD